MKSAARQQLLALAAFGAIAFLTLDWVVLTPLARSYKERSARIAQLRADVKRGDETMRQNDTVQRKWNEIRKSCLPALASQAEQNVLKALDEWSAASGVTVTSIRPQWRAGASDDYSLLECRVDASGSLSALMRFLYEIERSSIALRVESAELTARDNSGQQIALGLVVSGLRLAPLDRQTRS